MKPLQLAEGRNMPIGGVIAMRDARFEPEAGAAAVPCGGHKAGGLAFLPILNGYYRRDGQEVECGGLAEALGAASRDRRAGITPLAADECRRELLPPPRAAWPVRLGEPTSAKSS